MADKILIILGTLIIAVLLTILLLDFEGEYKILVNILSISGFIIMIVQYFYPKK